MPHSIHKSALPETLLSLKSGQAPKTGPRSHGAIHYRLLTDADHQQLYITITGNDGGGYFGKDIIPIARIEQCLHAQKSPLSSAPLKTVFISQSANNAGFLAAILRAEGLLLPVDGAVHQHQLAPPSVWSTWKAAALATVTQATPFQPEPTRSTTRKPENTALAATEQDLAEEERLLSCLQQSLSDKPTPPTGDDDEEALPTQDPASSRKPFSAKRHKTITGGPS
ncbi:MAG: hypothetical protein ACXV8Q_04015 [Methylobacter sp.]